MGGGQQKRSWLALRLFATIFNMTKAAASNKKRSKAHTLHYTKTKSNFNLLVATIKKQPLKGQYKWAYYDLGLTKLTDSCVWSEASLALATKPCWQDK